MTADPRIANIDLMNNYAHALDTRDWDLFASLFTPDAVFTAQQYGEGAVPGDDFMALEGRDTIVSTIRRVGDGLSATQHMLANHMVNPAPDGLSARASCYLRAHHVGNRDRSHLFEESLGRFDLETVCDDGTWKIARMKENIFIILGTSEAFDHG